MLFSKTKEVLGEKSRGLSEIWRVQGVKLTFMCENELWCPECGLREGNLDSEDRDNQSFTARSKFTLGFESYLSISQGSFLTLLAKKSASHDDSSKNRLICVVCELMGFQSGRSYFIFHFLTQMFGVMPWLWIIFELTWESHAMKRASAEDLSRRTFCKRNKQHWTCFDYKSLREGDKN